LFRVLSDRNEELRAASERGDLRTVERLISAGSDVNSFDELGMTALHYAVREEHTDVVEFLVKHGADVNAHHEESIGNTPLGEVAGNCSLAIATLLVNAGADPTIPGWMQLTALHKAAKRKRGDGPAVYQLLLKAASRFRSAQHD
jgi:ankyrin repeat protein